MIYRSSRLGVLLPILLVSCVDPSASALQDQAADAPSAVSISVNELRLAALSWEVRPEPDRAIVDQVCIVPDEATFLAVISTWDRAHFFPVLIEDVELNLRFIRAFRPTSIVRYGPATPPALDSPRKRWDAAVQAVGSAWKDTLVPNAPLLPGDGRPPRDHAAPGVVVSHPEANDLAGAVALAAGRFQPLLRWDPAPEIRFQTVPSTERAKAMALDLEKRVETLIPQADRLGDDCDFLTLAGDYPYKYQGGSLTIQPGPAAFDDLLGREIDTPDDRPLPRWAYTGRLLGGPAQSVYQAMCSLFLAPTNSAALWNAYGGGKPWSDYDTRPAAQQLERAGIRVQQLVRPEPRLAAWHAGFDPRNPYPLIFINSSGGPGDFSAPGGKGFYFDVPRSSPTAVHMIHSFSAANPKDPNTIAGRWLAQGAFAYFGSAHEPYLSAFRSPELVASLLIQGVPFSAAARLTPSELPQLGTAWRLVYLGDPLYRLKPGRKAVARLENWEPTISWPRYSGSKAPGSDADPLQTLSWALRAAFLDAAEEKAPRSEIADRLLALDRNAVAPPNRPIFDALLVDTLFELDRVPEVVRYLAEIPANQASAKTRRWLENARVVCYQKALAAKEWDEALRFWRQLIQTRPADFVEQVLSDRLQPLASSPDRRRTWLAQITEILNASELSEPLATSLRKRADRLRESP